jgi:type II secretory ATPase GspE/PulE/Tfp pilus assembly ATPase PilB-like protein
VETLQRNQDGAAQVVGQDYAFRYLVLPLDLRGDELVVAAVKADGMHELEALVRYRVTVEQTMPADELREKLRTLYRNLGTGYSLGKNEQREESMRAYVGSLFEDALTAHTSDVHIEPTDDGGRVRFRVDRTLREVRTLSRDDFQSLVSILKHSSNLKIDVTREFQDGSFSQATPNGRKVDCRVSAMPVNGSEKIVLRLLGSYATLRTFERLGMPPGLRDRYMEVLANPSGVHIVSGPTGMGKTTTVFAILNTVDEGKNICTVEDPVEIRLRGAYQVEVNEKHEVSFASAMRAFMRQDPDVIFCGEMRDDETAFETMKGGLSGRVVYSTIHSPDAVRVVDRLVEFGVRRGTIGSALKSVLAQRIVRKLCECRKEVTPSITLRRAYPVQFEESGLFSKTGKVFGRNPKGCQACHRTGIAGQAAIFELFAMSDEIEDAIVHEASRAALYRLALSEGYVPMREQAAQLIADGTTSVDEVLQVLSLSKNAA